MALEWDDVPAAAPAPKKPGARTVSWLTPSEGKVGSADRMLFTERLALLLETGVALHDALQVLEEQAAKPRLRRIIGEIAADIVGGQRFSEALSKHPDLFPPTYINLIGASEAGGFLPQVLEQLVELDEKQEKLRSTIVSALSYPGFLVVFSVLVVIFILVVVFPKFSVMFGSIYEELPFTTKFLIGASELLVGHGLALSCGVLALLVTAVAALRRPDMRERLDRLKLRVPGVRDIFIKIYLTRLMRVMGISLERGVTILATLDACRNVIPNAEFRRFIGQLEIQVTEGKGIAAGFKDSTLIPTSVRQMIATGEETGTLGRVMGRVADFYERDLTRQLNQLAKMAEPVMLLVMGVLVGTIVTSIILPIFKMSRAVH
ncbi:Type II secretion system protein F [Massilia sp. Bi118]|uniref:type II secretion system F family protein n=1 Tax=Massilia sp. Bi118 TaxID=2822346 RepID=UPI001D403CA2|nr:type II secretion system F family protein [Massilia sp. Bi118]CAH0248651.1 Type II secretion system protein F [Massilia sp. Bi118]